MEDLGWYKINEDSWGRADVGMIERAGDVYEFIPVSHLIVRDRISRSTAEEVADAVEDWLEMYDPSY